MPVPEQVRSAALAAFDARRADALVLELLDDTCVGPWQMRQPLPEGVTRSLVFAGPGLMVRLDVLAQEPQGNSTGEQGRSHLAMLEVELTPDRPMFVEVLTPRSELRLRTGPGGRLQLTAPAQGPLSLLIDAEGVEQHWQTSWVTL